MMIDRGVTETELDEYLERLNHPPEVRRPDTDRLYVSVEDVLEEIRDMAGHPWHMFRADDLIDRLRVRLMRIGRTKDFRKEARKVGR